MLGTFGLSMRVMCWQRRTTQEQLAQLREAARRKRRQDRAEKRVLAQDDLALVTTDILSKDRVQPVGLADCCKCC